MSTKIYNAFKLSDKPLLIHEVNHLFDKVREPMAEKAHEMLNSKILRVAVAVMDKRIAVVNGYKKDSHLFNDEVNKQSCIGYGHRSIIDEIEEDRIKNRRNCNDPYTNITVYSDENGTYACLFSEMNDIKKIFSQRLKTQDFSYWDNTDQPDNASDEEWQTRKETWENLFGDTHTYSARGASFELVEKNIIHFTQKPIRYPDNPDDDLKQIPSELIKDKKERAIMLAMDQPEAEPDDNVKEDLKKGRLALFMAHRRKLEKGDNPAFNAIVEKFMQLLPDTYSFAELREDFETTKNRLTQKTKKPSI